MQFLNKFKSKYLNNNSDNDIFRNMGILALGAGSAQAIGLAVTPVLTRIYTPEDFGLLSIFMSAVALMVPFSSLRYAMAIPLPKNDGIALNLLVLSVAILLILTMLSTLFFLFFSSSIFALFSASDLAPYWWLLPISIFGMGLFEILNNWAIRKKEFKAISKANFSQSLGSAILKVILGLMGMQSLGLLLGNIFNHILGATMLAISSLYSFKESMLHISKKRIIFLLNRYVEYPKYRLPSQFVLVFTLQAPLLFLAAFFGPDVVGYFGLTMIVLAVPFTLFGNTTAQAYYAEIAKIGRKNPEEIYEVTKHTLKGLFLFSIGPFLILLIGSPWLFSLLFGENWHESGVYASIMSFYMLTAFVSSPITNTLNVFEYQLTFLKLNIMRLILLLMSFFVSWMSELDATATIFVYSIVMSLYFLYVTYFIIKVIKKEILSKQECNVDLKELI